MRNSPLPLACCLLLLGLLGADTARAQILIPDPSLSIVPEEITITPDGGFAYVVQVNANSGGTPVPVPGALVYVRFSELGTHLIAWSDAYGDAPSHLETAAEPFREYTGVTDSNGQAEFRIGGGGCIQYDVYPGPSYIAQVGADGIVLGEPAVNSPDVVRNDNGKKCTMLGTCIQILGFTSVSASDAAYHAPNFSGGLVDLCSDFTAPYGDGCSAADAAFASYYIGNGIGTPAHCGP